MFLQCGFHLRGARSKGDVSEDARHVGEPGVANVRLFVELFRLPRQLFLPEAEDNAIKNLLPNTKRQYQDTTGKLSENRKIRNLK